MAVLPEPNPALEQQRLWKPLTAFGLAVAMLLLLIALGAGIAAALSLLFTGSLRPVSPLHLQIGVLVSSLVVAALVVVLLRARPDQAAVLGAPRGGIMTLIFVPLGFALAALLYQFARIAIATNIAAPTGRSVAENELTLLASNDKWLVIVGAIVAAPLVEELILRGLLLPALTRSRLRFAGAAVVTTLLFVIMHPGGLAKFGSVSVLLDWHFIMSLGLCVTWWLARSVWPCMLAHAASNMVLIAMVLLRL